MFDVRIEVQGLFRIVPIPFHQPQRILAVAPWVVPARSGECPHDLTVQWKPRQLGHPVPGDAETVWRLEGQRLSFDFGEDGPSTLEVDLDQLQIPWMHQRKSNGQVTREGIFDPEERPEAAIKDEALRDPGEFQAIDDAGYPVRRNREGVMGQVLIDRGKLVTDDVEAIPTVITTGSYDEGSYSGTFTNRLALIARDVSSFQLVTQDLVNGESPTGRVSLQPEGGRLQLRVKHICPQFLIHDRPVVPPAEDPEYREFRDEDFRFLYDLSREPAPIQERPIPVRRDDPDSKPRWDCGAVGG